MSSGSGHRVAIPATSVIPKEIIPFTSTSQPIISDYQTYYAMIYGEHPNLNIKTIDEDGNYRQRNEQALFVMSAGLIDSISWDFADTESGFITLS
jgi:hypothetical protein